MIKRIFFQPYPWLPAALFALFVLSFALHPLSPFLTHHLADPDDYMRLNEVASWLQGQSWYDLSVPRLSPDAHTVVHWSRLIDLPIALVALPFIPWFGVTNAVLAASLIVPLIWFVVLLALLPALARHFVGAERANLACIAVFFAPLLLFNYTPGRVDHHGVQAILAGFTLLCLQRIIMNDRGRFFAVLAALAFSCGFWIGTEALPWAILFITCLGIAAAWQSGTVARDAALFGVSLPLFTTAFVPAALPVAEFSSRALSWFSPAYAIFAALSGAIFVIGWQGGKHVTSKPLRLALFALLGLAAAAAFFILIPSSLRGPFTDYDTFDSTTALDNIAEAQPLFHALRFNRFMPATLMPAGITFARFLFLPLAALLFGLCAVKRAHAEMRLVWLVQSVFLLAALTLTVFWQLRVGIFMEIFALAPLTALLCKCWDRLSWSLWDRPLFWAEIGVFLLLGPLPVVLLPALVNKTALYPDLILFPATRTAASCPLEPVEQVLNDTAGLGAEPLTILNTSDTGPQLLLETKHRVIAGNFDVPGNEDTFQFFHATDDAQALAAAHKWKVDLVLLCNKAPSIYLGKDYYALSHTQLLPGKDGLLHFANIDKDQPLIQRLIKGEIPVWLKPIEIPLPSDYLLFRVQDPKGKK